MPYDPYTGPISEEGGWEARWQLVAKPEKLEVLNIYWFLFGFFLFLCVIANTFLVQFILRNPKLRSNSFNLFLLGLCIPDGLFSWLCSFNCWPNLYNQGWNGGDFMCDFQGFYILLCITCSCWTSFMIAYNMKKMTQKTISVQKYKAPTRKEVIRTLVKIWVGAACLAFLPQLGWILGNNEDGDPIFPMKNNAYHGMFCVPMEYNAASVVLLWGILLFGSVLGPAIGIAYCYLWCFHMLARMEQRKSNVSYKVARQSITSSSGKNKVAAMARSFVKFFVVYVTLWAPALICLWAIGVYSGLVFIGGLAGHCHGLISPIVYMTKSDIKRELTTKYKCLRSLGIVTVSLRASKMGGTWNDKSTMSAKSTAEFGGAIKKGSDGHK